MEAADGAKSSARVEFLEPLGGALHLGQAGRVVQPVERRRELGRGRLRGPVAAVHQEPCEDLGEPLGAHEALDQLLVRLHQVPVSGEVGVSLWTG